METRFRFRYVNEVAGTFVIAAIVLLAVSVFLTMRARRWFKPTHEFSVLLPESSFGLKAGSAVQVLGITVGAVKSVRPEGDDVLAQVGIDAEFRRFVYADSVALVKKKFGVAGDAFLEIAEGSGKLLTAGATLKNSKPFEELPGLVEQLLGDLKSEAVPALQDLRDTARAYTMLARTLSDPKGKLQQGLASWGRLAEVAVEGEGTLGRFLNDPTVYEQVEGVLGRADAVLSQSELFLKELRGTQSKLAEVVETLRTEVGDAPGLVRKTHEILDEVHRLTTQVREATGRLPSILESVDASARSVPGVILQTQKTLRSIERLVEGLQRHWLVRRYVPEQSGGKRLAPQESGTKR